MGFLRSVPWEIEEQAMIDGYSRLAVILKVAPRLIVPGILTVVVFTFTLVMQEFVYALTFISSVEKMTVSLGVPIALVRGDVYHWGRSWRPPCSPAFRSPSSTTSLSTASSRASLWAPKRDKTVLWRI